MGEDPSEIRHEIEETRARLGDTVEALAYEADVRARVKDAVNERIGSAKSKIGDAVESAKATSSRIHPLWLAVAGIVIAFFVTLAMQVSAEGDTPDDQA
jgi:hypothetical protein